MSQDVGDMVSFTKPDAIPSKLACYYPLRVYLFPLPPPGAAVVASEANERLLPGAAAAGQSSHVYNYFFSM